MDVCHEWNSFFDFSDVDVPQVPTPPFSDGGDNNDLVVSVSTTFYPGAPHSSIPPDLALLSSDSVFFYAHFSLLEKASNNHFRSLLPHSLSDCNSEQSLVIHVPETSTVLNIILHTIYDISCVPYSHPLETVISAVTQFPSYGILPKSSIRPSSALYSHLLSLAPLAPLEVYTLASSFDLIELATATSSHLLSYPLFNITDEMAERIGPIYLRRLFFLHIGRCDALRRVLLDHPHPHPPTDTCHFSEQKKLSRAWALASAYLAWDAKPDMSVGLMEAALRPLAEHLTCDDCKATLDERIRNLTIQWSVVKRTI